jgi:hypothetical protein
MRFGRGLHGRFWGLEDRIKKASCARLDDFLIGFEKTLDKEGRERWKVVKRSCRFNATQSQN